MAPASTAPRPASSSLAHESINVTAGQYVRQQVFHVQHVNAYDSRLKQWIRRFNGVATHYYLPGWRRLNCLTPEMAPLDRTLRRKIHAGNISSACLRRLKTNGAFANRAYLGILIA
jgi:hypothetical protein